MVNIPDLVTGKPLVTKELTSSKDKVIMEELQVGVMMEQTLLQK